MLSFDNWAQEAASPGHLATKSQSKIHMYASKTLSTSVQSMWGTVTSIYIQQFSCTPVSWQRSMHFAAGEKVLQLIPFQSPVVGIPSVLLMWK